VAWLELEVLAGLEPFAVRELQSIGSAPLDVDHGHLRLRSEGASLQAINGLRSVVAAYLVEHFAIPRPKALLGDEYLRRVRQMCDRVLVAWPHGTFRTLHLGAAGAESAVMSRIKRELAQQLRLETADDGGDLFVRIRRAPGGWQVLVRTSPRPLSARAWRVCNLPGALNATAAHSMVALTEPVDSEVFVNVGCGSGTLLIERLAVRPARRVIGYDLDEHALSCARTNADASGYGAAIELALCDARSLPLESASVRSLVADLPYAMLLGSGQDNASLYPDLLREAARVVMPGGHAVVITTQNRLMRGVLERVFDEWDLEARVPVKIAHRGGFITPNICSLVRRHRV